jgi:pimeloyl-ACP methyl ester carboxylesterase
MGYANQQATKPQTLGYGLTDSPAGQAAWIYEKFHGWTDNQGTPESVLSRDELLDNIMLYWLPANATSSARLYWESTRFYRHPNHKIDIPVGVSMFRKELIRASRRWAENSYSNIIHWNELDKGGHFAAFEQPELFTQELRQCFRSLRPV